MAIATQLAPTWEEMTKNCFTLELAQFSVKTIAAFQRELLELFHAVVRQAFQEIDALMEFVDFVEVLTATVVNLTHSAVPSHCKLA